MAAGGALAQEAKPAPKQASFPNNWFFTKPGTNERREAPMKIENKPAPKLKVKDWIGESKTLEELKGRVVVVDFWATWCGPCVRAIPKNIKLVEKYEDDVTFLGVHNGRSGMDKMPSMAKQMGINYPLCVDDGTPTQKAYNVAFWPTYVVIDHTGVVRASGLKPNHVEDVVKILVAEKKAAEKQVG